MLFSNLLFAVALTVVWPLGMLGLLAACAWLERRTLVAEEIIPRRLRRMDGKPPEAVEAMVLEETRELVADHWSTPNHPYLGVAPSSNGRRPEAAQPAPGSAPPAVAEPGPRRAVWPRDAGAPQPAPAERGAAPDPGPRDPLEPLAEPERAPPAPRVVPGRMARLARRRPARGRHERR
jgi:hypothetical protein